MSVKNQIESLLFISHKPLSIKELAKSSNGDEEAVKKAVNNLMADYKEKDSGIQIIYAASKYQMTTAGDSSEVVDKFIKSEMTGELTRPSLEALTVIAYRGPISKAELELIRGVNCSIILRNLLIRGLIESKEDKRQSITRYQITHDFLKHLGLSSVKDLPDYEKLNHNNNLEKLLEGVSSVNGNGHGE